MTTKKLGSDQVEAWLHVLREGKADLESRLTPLLEERRRLEEQEGILIELLSTLNGQPAASDKPSLGHGSSPVAVSSGSTIREEVEARVIEILADEGKPLHINEIHTRYRERGWKVPGAGEPVNITSHIRVSDRIKSPKRGIYGLAEHVAALPPAKVTSKKKRRK